MITLWKRQIPTPPTPPPPPPKKKKTKKEERKKKKLQRVFYAIIDRLMFNDSYRFTASDCSKDENECVKKSY